MNSIQVPNMLDDVEGFQVVPFIDQSSLDSVTATEGLTDRNSYELLIKDRKEEILAKRGYVQSSALIAENNDEFKIQSYVISNGTLVEKHLYIVDEMLYFEEYIQSLFVYLSNLKNDEIVKIFFTSYYNDLYMLEDIVPICNALSLTDAHTIGMVTNSNNEICTILALGCKDISVGRFGVLKFRYPDDYTIFGRKDIYEETLNSLYSSYVTRGILTQEELDTMKSSNGTIIKYSSDLA